MASWSIEQRGCFTPGVTESMVEYKPCGQLPDAAIYSAWTDGTNWRDLDGTIVGWIEADGTLYPPADVPLS